LIPKKVGRNFRYFERYVSFKLMNDVMIIYLEKNTVLAQFLLL